MNENEETNDLVNDDDEERQVMDAECHGNDRKGKHEQDKIAENMHEQNSFDHDLIMVVSLLIKYTHPHLSYLSRLKT